LEARTAGDVLSDEDRKASLHDAALYINRELSLLEFQARVLEEAQDERNPLLERVKFLAIFGSNLDEFFMVRVAGIRREVETLLRQVTPDGLTPGEELEAIHDKVQRLHRQAQDYLNRKLLPDLGREGIDILDDAQLGAALRDGADAIFRDSVQPHLAPLVVAPGCALPYIANLGLGLAIVIRDPEGRECFAWVGVPEWLPRLIPLPCENGGEGVTGSSASYRCLMWLEQLIIARLGLLFPGLEVVSAHAFRVVRNADIEPRELEADDFLETMPSGNGQRKFGAIVQVTVDAGMPEPVRRLLLGDLAANPPDLLAIPGPLGLSALWQAYNGVDREDLKYPPYRPYVPQLFRGAGTGDIFAAIRAGDILLHHPYDSFEPIVDFLRAAVNDPQVIAVKQTLYRVGENSPVVEALLDAAAAGKQVAVLVELNARFEEESNIVWARMLKHEGVQLVYGVEGLKTHSKIAMVVRREDGGLRRYLHLGTGNYNAVTSRLYEDIGMFTCDEAMGADADELFDYLTGRSDRPNCRKLLVAPSILRGRLASFIEREIGHAEAGRVAHIMLKVNSLVDPRMIRLLYRASMAGVRVDLLVRGICCLRPGIAGLSENIRVSSLVGQYLEHSRIFWFLNNGDEEVYLGSADLMQRNLDHRVEVVFPVTAPAQVRYLRDQVLESHHLDNFKVRELQSSGRYRRLEPGAGEALRSAQEYLMDLRSRSGQEECSADLKTWTVATSFPPSTTRSFGR
jgi:polyphosphate kinase